MDQLEGIPERIRADVVLTTNLLQDFGLREVFSLPNASGYNNINKSLEGSQRRYIPWVPKGGHSTLVVHPATVIEMASPWERHGFPRKIHRFRESIQHRRGCHAGSGFQVDGKFNLTLGLAFNIFSCSYIGEETLNGNVNPVLYVIRGVYSSPQRCIESDTIHPLLFFPSSV